MNNLVSVIIPCYKFVDYIEDCIHSVFKQKTNFDFNVIVRDDGSDDGTNIILEQLKSIYENLIILDGFKNIGGFKNIKTLIEFTDAKYIAYLDGDDLFGDEDKLQRQFDFLETNPNYVMHFTGCRYLYENGKIHPDDSRVICSVKKTITTKDLLENNYVGFGRMFRNIRGTLKDEFENLPYADWPMSYELSKHGLIGYEEFFGGLYRISDKGIYSKTSEEEKVLGFNKVKKFLNEDYLGQKYKTITIIDSYISNNSVLKKLKTAISNLKIFGNKILLVSNTVPPNDVINSVDYFLYNHENKLFSQNFDDINKCELWKSYEHIVIHEITEEFQKHGLSVLSNLFNCLDLVKSLGYTHFQRIEVDDLYTMSGYEFMNQVPSILEKEIKKSLFYFNHGRDVSFHYFYSEIDFFLKTFPRITNEDSYRKYLMDSGFGSSFKTVEFYLYDNLKKGNLDEVLIKNGEDDMYKDFDGTLWNTESSQATIHEMYEGCTTKIYKVKDSSNIGVVSYNYNNFAVRRKIVIELSYGQEILYHNLDYFDAWAYNIFDSSLSKISVYNRDNDELLYEMENKNIDDYIEFK